MFHTVMVVIIILFLTVIMIMSGRGGGNFCVIAVVLSGVPIHTASNNKSVHSARNVIKGEVKKVTHGAVNSEIIMELPGGAEIVSIITKAQQRI